MVEHPPPLTGCTLEVHMASQDSKPRQSPIDTITSAPWRRRPANPSSPVRDANQIKPLAEILTTPRGTLRVWTTRRRRWLFEEHEGVTVKEARELTGSAVGEYIPDRGTPMLLYRDAAKADALRATGFLVETDRVRRGGRNETQVGIVNFARMAT